MLRKLYSDVKKKNLKISEARNLYLALLLMPQVVLAAGGFEKPVLWSARAAYHGGAYSSAVTGAEALLFNPANLSAQKESEFVFAASAASGGTKAPVLENEKEVSTFNGPVTPLALVYSKNITTEDAIGIGLYSVGGLNVEYDSVSTRGLGSEFSPYNPDVYGKLMVLELGLGYARRFSKNLKLGVTLRQHLAKGGFSQLQVSRAKGLSGMGIPDGTVLAISRGEFEDLTGFSFGSYLLGSTYITDSGATSVSLTFRSPVKFRLKSDGNGEVVYSNTGAAATGATAGQVYQLQGDSTLIESSLPQALTLGVSHQLTSVNSIHAEYAWTDYSENERLKIDGSFRNPVDTTTTKVADVPLNWHDLHDFKFGWTNRSFERWTIGGGYSLALPVTDKDSTGPTFAAPANYHHFYLGAGREFRTFRLDFAAESYFGKGPGKTQAQASGNQESPSIEGDYSTKAYAFFLSFSRPL